MNSVQSTAEIKHWVSIRLELNQLFTLMYKWNTTRVRSLIIIKPLSLYSLRVQSNIYQQMIFYSYLSTWSLCDKSNRFEKDLYSKGQQVIHQHMYSKFICQIEYTNAFLEKLNQYQLYSFAWNNLIQILRVRVFILSAVVRIYKLATHIQIAKNWE